MMFYSLDLNEDNNLLHVIYKQILPHRHKLLPPFLQVKANAAAAALPGTPPQHEMLCLPSTIKLRGQDLSFLCSFSLHITSHMCLQFHAVYDLCAMKASRANLGRTMQTLKFFI